MIGMSTSVGSVFTIGLRNAHLTKHLPNPLSQIIRRYFSDLPTRGFVYYMKSNPDFESGKVIKSKGGRPSLVVSAERAMEATSSVVMAKLSNASQLKPDSPFAIYVKKEDTGLSKDSKINTSQLFTTDLDRVKTKKPVGRVSPEDMKRVDENLNLSISSKLGSGLKPTFKQGSVVKISEGPAKGRYGIVVSNNKGNYHSEIVMISHISGESTNEFQVRLSKGKPLFASCNEIDTIDQSELEKIRDLPEETWNAVHNKVKEALSIKSKE